MTLRDMEYILVIKEEQSITKAASRLFMAQPALSQCVQKVEKELGVPIFLRGSGGVTLTEEGLCFIDFAQNTLREKRDFEKKLRDIQNVERGEIHLGITGTQATYVLPYFLPQFKMQYPLIDIVLVEATSNGIENKLAKGELDIGILHPPIIHKNLDCFEISHDEMVIVPRSNSRFQPFIYFEEGEDTPYLDIEFLKNEPLVLTHSWQRSRMTCDQIFQKAGFSPTIKQQSKSISTLDALAQVDYASTLLPSKQVSEALKRRGCYKIPSDYRVSYSFFAATLKETYISAATGKLLELLQEIRGSF